MLLTLILFTPCLFFYCHAHENIFSNISKYEKPSDDFWIFIDNLFSKNSPIYIVYLKFIEHRWNLLLQQIHYPYILIDSIGYMQSKNVIYLMNNFQEDISISFWMQAEFDDASIIYNRIEECQFDQNSSNEFYYALNSPGHVLYIDCSLTGKQRIIYYNYLREDLVSLKHAKWLEEMESNPNMFGNLLFDDSGCEIIRNVAGLNDFELVAKVDLLTYLYRVVYDQLKVNICCCFFFHENV